MSRNIFNRNDNINANVKAFGVGTLKEFPNGGSTNIALSASAMYTSSWLNALEHDKITGTVYASGSEGTFYVEQTPDTENTGALSGSDFIGCPVCVEDGIGKAFAVELISKYVRVKYINGASNQTEFRLYSYLKG